MNKIKLTSLFIIIGFFLAAGCIAQTKSPERTTIISPLQSPKDQLNGVLSVSIGDYNAKLPVYLDNTSVGEVSPGKPQNINVTEGYHNIKVCDGNTCEEVDIEIKYAIKTTIDFGERLIMDIPKGPLSISIGDYNARLPVYLDNTSVGEVSRGMPLNISVKEGRYTVKVCSVSICEQQGVMIKSEKQTLVDFEERLTKNVPQGALTVSIGGYDAEFLPVLLDNMTVGEVSQGKPLDLVVSEGRHTIKVCLGVVCETKDVDIRFAQPSFVDFGEDFKKDVEFPKPTVRIANFFVSDNALTLNAEFINPDKNDLTMTATIGCGYSYVDYVSNQRKNDFAQTQLIQYVKAGQRSTQPVTLYMTKGSRIIASEPMIVDVVTKI